MERGSERGWEGSDARTSRRECRGHSETGTLAPQASGAGGARWARAPLDPARARARPANAPAAVGGECARGGCRTDLDAGDDGRRPEHADHDGAEGRHVAGLGALARVGAVRAAVVEVPLRARRPVPRVPVAAGRGAHRGLMGRWGDSAA